MEEQWKPKGKYNTHHSQEQAVEEPTKSCTFRLGKGMKQNWKNKVKSNYKKTELQVRNILLITWTWKTLKAFRLESNTMKAKFK